MTRRGRNEGNIYLRADGRWEGRIHLGYESSGRVRKSVYGRTRREVQEKLTQLLRARDLGLPLVRNGRQTVAGYLTVWLEEAVRPAVRPKTYTTYETLVRVHLIPGLGRVPLVSLSPQQVQTFLNQKLREGLAPRSVAHMRAVLRRALNQAVRWDMVPRNVAVLVDSPRVPAFEVIPLSSAQARTLLDASRNDRLGALFAVALLTGMRQGEMLGLAWDDVDLVAGTVAVRRALQRVGGHLGFVEPKTRRSARTLVLAPLAIDALREHRRRQLQEKLWQGSRWRESGLVFTTSVGTPLDGPTVTRRLQALLADAGLPRQRFHDLRHACASLLLLDGVHPRVVMEMLGHSQIALTMNTYSHVASELQRDAARRIDALVRATGSG